MAEGIEATCVEHESSEEVGDREADNTDSDGREPSSKRSKTTIIWSFSAQNEVRQKNGKRSGPSFHQCLEISIVSCALSARKLSCGHQGAAGIQDHISTQSHQKLAKSMFSHSRLSFASSNPLSDQVGLHINR